MPSATFVPHPDRRPSVVAGASSGIGAAVAKSLAGAGHPVVLGARRVELCAEIASRITTAGGEAHAEKLDLADTDSVSRFAAAAQKLVGDVDVVVMTAGHAYPGTALGTEPSAFAHTVSVNLLGAHRLLWELAPAMVARRHGDLVFVSSEAVRAPRPMAAAYVASKFGLEGLVRTLQLELEGTGVRATIVQPGQTLTGMGTDWEPEVATAVLEEWIRRGVARHNHFLRAPNVAAAVLAAVSTPPGTHLPMIEVQPEAPITDPIAEATPAGEGGAP